MKDTVQSLSHSKDKHFLYFFLYSIKNNVLLYEYIGSSQDPHRIAERLEIRQTASGIMNQSRQDAARM